MKHCDLTLPSAEENLACDEALLDLCEDGHEQELLRFWEPATYFAVLGYANHAASEVRLPFCERNQIPVLRRCSGGGTVLQGPGVLNYSLVLRIGEEGPTHSISSTNDFVLERHRDALASLLKAPVEKRGQTDLAIGGLKFCGNAQRRRKRCLLFHGSFLLHLDFELLEHALPMPSRQPEYRASRSHAEFLMNLRVQSSQVRNVLRRAWGPTETLTMVPMDQIVSLARRRYSAHEWNFKF